MTLDTDEFFIADQFENAKKFIVANNITHSACAQHMYLKAPIYRDLNYNMSACTTFFGKINMFSRLTNKRKYPVLIDGTKTLNHYPFAKYYVLENIILHHMLTVRKNLTKKYQNSSAKAVNHMVEENFDAEKLIKDGAIAVVPNIFGIEI